MMSIVVHLPPMATRQGHGCLRIPSVCNGYQARSWLPSYPICSQWLPGKVMVVFVLHLPPMANRQGHGCPCIASVFNGYRQGHGCLGILLCPQWLPGKVMDVMCIPFCPKWLRGKFNHRGPRIAAASICHEARSWMLA